MSNLRFSIHWLTLAAVFLAGCSQPAEIPAAQVNWQEDFEQAVRTAAGSRKPLLVQVTADWCGYCHKMFRETFTDERVVRQVNDCFVPVKLDADKHPRLAASLGAQALPTTVILSPESKVLKRVTGFQAAPRFAGNLQGHCRQNDRSSDVAANETDVRPQAEQTRVAFGGYCPVSMLDEGKLTTGSAEHVGRHRDRTVQFASAEFQRRFEARPERYWPGADGTCPVSTAEDEQRHAGDPRLAMVFRERLWFFSSPLLLGRQARFCRTDFQSVRPNTDGLKIRPTDNNDLEGPPRV